MRAKRRPIKKTVLTILAIFLFPLAVHGALYSVQSRPQSYDRADWSSTGMLPAPGAEPEARLLIFTGRTGRWKGIFAVHSWVVFKAEVGSVTPHVCQVQGVWVPPDLRGRGLAARGMAAVAKISLASIAPVVTLYVNDYNAPARAAYLRAGFTETGTFMSVLF